jgi:3-oxoadipate enol-lactonase
MKRSLHVNGIDLKYEEYGNGKAVVLLHGFCGSSQYWHKTAPILSEHYRIIVPDLRGHGESSIPEGTYTMETMADDIAGLLDTLQIEKAVLLGHSLGGYVTSAFVELHPDKLLGCGLIHSTALPDTEAAKQKRLQGIEQIRKEGIEPYVKNLIPNLFTKAELIDMAGDVEQIIQIGLQTKPEGAIHTLEGMMQRSDRSGIVSDSNLPILLVAGAEDTVMPPERTFTVTSPNTFETTFENIAHMSMIESPDQLNQVIMEYLSSI